jgi:hypothetical protein
MKKKYFLVFLVLVMAMFLTSCSGITTPALNVDQEEEIKEVVANYWTALSNKQYSLAKSYCIPYGNAFYAVEEYQNSLDYSFATLNWNVYTNWVAVTGNDSIVNIDLTLKVTVCFENICSEENETLYNFPMDLTKIEGVWKLI